ncbi:hypothetical protein [Pseudarthrobacter sp. BIM B-2242]|uniref:hypothetical protein n=1 Tax=Pseudarthrobacter sp. BIM B-2242 TaxID=2772401 RepID=UPI00168A970D|nr:hypothetical protein [Pseudarthrobacter sp. BIM B-2242]QOD05703.1 hypothetical protein IDT60_21915 [Pseudarthrobacter sp. BIM B-2242]
MTAIAIAPASSKEMLTAYRREQRMTSTDNGSPCDRSGFPGLSLTPDGMIYRRGTSLLYQPLNDKARDLDHVLLTELLTHDEKITAIADKGTFEALQTVAATEPEDQYGSIAKRLKVLNSLPASVRMPILTDALAYRYWLPDGKDEASFADWAAAFNATGPTASLSMRRLIDLAVDGVKYSGLKFDNTVSALRRAEARLMEQCVWSNISSDVQVFGMLESYSNKINALRTIDPGLLELHVLDGRVCKVKPMNNTHRDFSASVSQPFKLKENKPLRMTDGYGLAETTMTELRFGAGEMHAVFDQPSGTGQGQAMVMSAKQGTRALYVAEGTFDMPASRPVNRRWLSGTKVERVADRTVPLDVILAGAPVE